MLVAPADRNSGSEEWLHSILYSIGDGVITTDSRGRVQLMNPVAAALTGWPEAEARGKPLEEIFPIVNEETRATVPNPLPRVLAEGVMVGLANHTMLIARDGSERPIADSGAPVRNPQGEIIGAVLVFRDQTKERQEQEAVLEARRFAESVLATVREPLLVLDAEWRVEAANRSFYRAFGTVPEETIGRRLYDLGNRQWDIPALRQLLEALLPQNTAFDDFEVEHDFPTIGRRTFLLNARRLYREVQKTDKVLLALEDITERKRAEAESRAKDERLRLAVDAGDVGLWDWDLQSNRVIFSAEWKRQLGYEDHEILHEFDEWRQRVHPDDLPGALQVLDEYVADPRGHLKLEFRMRHKDGSYRWIASYGSTHCDAAGRPARILGSHTDITERKNLEEKLRAISDHLSHVTAVSPAILYTLKIDGNTLVPTWVSENATAILGYSREEMLRPGWWFSRLHPDDRAEVISQSASMIHGERLPEEYRFLRKDGSVIWIRGEMRVDRDETGRAQQVVGAWLDISERKRLEDQFHQSQKMDAFGQLAGGVAHDFNNLLTVISGYSEILLSMLPASDPKREAVKTIQLAGGQAASLTRQLLAFSRQTVLQPVVLQLNDTVRETEKMLGRLIGEDVLLTTALDPAISRIRVDAGQIGQVLINLAVNARDAMPKGGKLTIATRNVQLEESYCRRHPDARPGPHVELSVTDNGCGMTPEVKARAFEPFFTTKSVGKGTGLGLATVYGIIRQSGGSVEIDSEPGQGTAVKIYFPAIAEEKPTPGSGTVPMPLRRGTETLLLVEDDAAVRAFAQRILEAQGYQVLVAARGSEALEIARNHGGGLDMLVADVVMPEMSGRELADELTARYPNLKVLYVSGYTNDAVVRHGILHDEVSFLQKPYTTRALAKKVREVLDRGQ